MHTPSTSTLIFLLWQTLVFPDYVYIIYLYTTVQVEIIDIIAYSFTIYAQQVHMPNCQDDRFVSEPNVTFVHVAHCLKAKSIEILI